MGIPGAPVQSAMDRNKKRGWNVTLVVLFSLFLLVSMTKIQAMVAGCDADEAASVTGAYEHEVGARRMLSASELNEEAERRLVLEEDTRRMLATRTSSGYIISYGALSANRVPCPPRSGRSYYTRNCYSAAGPARPYSRGCSSISRCARESR